MTFGSVTRAVLATAILAVAAAYVALGARVPWDFETYYYAASAFRSHLNPYSLDALSRLAGKNIELPFLYPPVTLGLFAPFTLMPLSVASYAWLGLKLILLLPLGWIWKRFFLPTTNPAVLVATTLLGFNLALLWDLRTGNVAVLEASLLWFGFALYVRNRPVPAGCLVSIGSVFKLIPALLLGLLVMEPRSRIRWTALVMSLALLVAIVTVPSNLSAEWRSALTAASSVPRPTGDINPSALGVADWITTGRELPPSVGPLLALLVYIIYCAAVLIVSLAAVLRSRASGSRAEQVVMVVLLWLLLSPRVMVYSYIMAIVPVLYAIETRILSRVGRGMAVLLVISQGVVRLLPGQSPSQLAPLSLLILIGAWAFMLRSPRTAAVPQPPPIRCT